MAAAWVREFTDEWNNPNKPIDKVMSKPPPAMIVVMESTTAMSIKKAIINLRPMRSDKAPGFWEY